MKKTNKPVGIIIDDLKERAKELNCLYEVQELLNKPETTIKEICEGLVDAIPPGWQYTEICRVKIIYENSTYQSDDFKETKWVQNADITIHDEVRGKISIYYIEETPPADEGPFLKEERKLINTIAEQVGLHILYQELKEVFHEQKKSKEQYKSDWWTILDLLKKNRYKTINPNLQENA